ncbi:MAG: menaquinone biosynthesis decarboxylase [Bacteroidales bacterium]|nr:menaquinone biosynthesis decarboxylase [Bacteroidales bacterium]
MAYKSLNHFISELEKDKELIRITEYVSPELEITELVDRISKSPEGGKALLFENTGTDFPIFINAMGSEKRICKALGVSNLEEVKTEIERLFTKLTSPKENLFDKLKLIPSLSNISSWIPKVISGRGKCQEHIINDPDLSKLPILKCWPEDGGPFITLPIVNTKDPLSGIRNVGMYRMQVFENNLTGMHWHKHKVGARHFNEYKKLGQKMPVAVALGGDPIYTYSATAPLPDNIDEYLLAGFLRKKKVELVKCITQDIEVPADADIIIEGYIDPSEDFIWEGPFGDHTGFYSLADWYPKFHVTCITHKKDAVYPATIVGVPPMEDAWIGKATERIFLAPIKLAILPEIIDYDLPFEGVAHNISIVKIDKTYAGQAFKVMNALWGAGQMMFNKIMFVIDSDIDIHNYSEVSKYIIKNINPERDILFTNGPLDVLDHSASNFTYGSKMGIDVTSKFDEELTNNQQIQQDFDKIDINNLKSDFTEIIDIKVFSDEILCYSIKKTEKTELTDLWDKLAKHPSLNAIKACLFFEELVDINDLNMMVWIASGNIDPKRDCIIYNSTKKSCSKLFIDASRKYKTKDNFNREWPNVVVSDDDTINKIDEKWNLLNLGDFIESPSLKYKKLNSNKGAISIENNN